MLVAGLTVTAVATPGCGRGPLGALPMTSPAARSSGRLAGMSDVTRLIGAAAAGDRTAAADLLPLVYDELRKLAAARMAEERPGHTLDATALVHEAYVRLVGDQRFDGRGQCLITLTDRSNAWLGGTHCP